MHRLAPAPAIARAAQPAPPERHGSVELGGDVRIGARHRRLTRLDAVEHKRGRLTGPKLDARPDVAAVDDPERGARRKAERQLGRAEQRAMRGERDLVAGAGIVEARGDVDDEAHLPAHGEHPADYPVAVHRLAGTGRGHEVLHLPHSVRHQESRDQDVGVGEVELLRAPALAVGRDTEQAPVVGVEDRREDARRVEARAAVPVDRPVGPDERDGVQVADQAVLGDRQVARPRCPPGSTGLDRPDSASVEVMRHQRGSSPPYGTRTSFPFAAERSSSS
jgi:hypothetical protein